MCIRDRHSTWHEYSDPRAVPKGLLDPDHGRLEQRIRALGISHDSDVVIYSNPFDNWGDEGRMFWMLEYLGHTRPVSYTHLRAHETPEHLVCRLLLEKKNNT